MNYASLRVSVNGPDVTCEAAPLRGEGEREKERTVFDAAANQQSATCQM